MASGPSEEPGISTGDLDAVVQGAEFFRSLVENGSDAIVSIDENSTVLYANQSVERVFGYEPEEMIGEKLTMIMPDRFHAEHFGAVDRYLETGDRNLDWNSIELPAEHRDGHEIPLSITFEEHSYEGDRVFSGIMRDISDRVQRERELERQNERLERFASIVSHDLRDPLQAARATTAVARAGDEEALDELDDIFDRMDELIGDVLTLAKQGQTVGETEPVELAAVTERAWSTAETGTATLSTAPELPTVAADPERLRTLFENLFRNAVEHGSTSPPSQAPEDAVEHGSTGSRPGADDAVEHGSTSPDSRARRDAADDGDESVTVTVGPIDGGPSFFVADDGDGFDEADPDRLFEYGYTTTADGTGFGLSIVSDIIAAHGWTISATESESGGARFEVVVR